MRTISCKLEDLKTMTLHIGYEGENDYTSVRIDAGSVFAQYPEAVPSLKVQPPKGNMYPVIVTRDGDIVIWDVSDSDTASNGNGEIQLTFTENTVVVKSCTGKTLVHRSLKATGPAPDPLIDFIDRAEEVVGEAQDAAEAAEAAAQHAPMIGLDGYWYKWDAETEGYVKTDTKARGEDGTNGVGITSVEKISTVGLVDTYRINFTNGTNTTYTVTNGQDGSVPIDDTTPAANKVFSSAKVDEELTDVKTDIHGLPDIKDSDAIGVNLDFSDPSGNVVLRLKNGEVETEKFNSAYASETQQSTQTNIDFDISDPEGNVALRIMNGHIFTERFNSAKYSAKIITLKTDGTGDFTTLKAALDSITDADPDTNPYEIHVYPGTYDTLEGFTEEEIQSADIGGGYTDQSMVGAKTKDGVSIIGIGNRDAIILTAELDTTNYSSGVRGNISTLNWKGTGRFENLTIKAKNLRYCVHDDFPCTHQYKRIVRNCAFFGSGLAYNPALTYGGGIAVGGMIGLFENCDFGYDWGLHSRQGGTGRSVVEWRNCIGNKFGVWDPTNENDKGYADYIINGCNFKKLTYTKANGTTPHIAITGSGNSNLMESVTSGYITKCGSIIKTKCTTTLPVGTMVAFASGASYMSKATDAETAIGVIINKDDNYDYVQTKGYINSALLSMTGLSIGDYVTVNSDMALTATGATASNAVGVVKWVDSDSNAYIWMLKGEM